MAGPGGIAAPIVAADGRNVGEFVVATVPRLRGTSADPTRPFENTGGASPSTIQLLEGAEYRYSVHIESGGDVTCDRPELVDPDDGSGRSGRLRPGLHTGLIPLRFSCDGAVLGRVKLEVRSRKLNYLAEYRWMLRDIAEEMSEAVMARFGASQHTFGVDQGRDAVTLYQRFAFLQSLLTGPEFDAAFKFILHRPHVGWEEEIERVQAGRPVKAGSYLARQISRPGPKRFAEQSPVQFLPQHIECRRTESTVDTVPNRFVRHALTRWRTVVAQILDALALSQGNAVTERGEQEGRELLDALDTLLSEDLLRNVGGLAHFPADNQVLQKREGYRYVFQAYAQFELAAQLSWAGGEDVYGAGSRDVATLYEFWVFLQLANLLASLVHADFDFSELLDISADGLGLNLRRGSEAVVRGTVVRLGRRLKVELWFNRTFSSGEAGGSWTRRMRPDCSLRVSAADDETSKFNEVWLHFDAKYRVESIEDIMGAPSGEVLTAKRADLLTMHAYRDAIRRSAGAYVVYPGSEQQIWREYHELLPGLGAFALRPSEFSGPDGASTLARFLEDVFVHAASQRSQHERSRFWSERIHRKATDSATPVAQFLREPPADTTVLLGFVRNAAHWAWIAATRLYNVRTGGRSGSVNLGARELAAGFVVLSCPEVGRAAIAAITDGPLLMDEDAMRANGYAEPYGSYYCFKIEPLVDPEWDQRLQPEWLESVRRFKNVVAGHPVALTWEELVSAWAARVGV